MPKLKAERSITGGLYAWRHLCPGCKDQHLIPMTGPEPWEFNGNLDRPTFSPSVKHTLEFRDPERKDTRCHYFIVDGNIQYCSDCTHELAGTTVPLPEIG